MKRFKKQLLLLGSFALLAATLAQPLRAEEPMAWSCTWKGTWGEKGNPKTDPMLMAGFLHAADGGLVLSANSKDSFGPSRIRGGCGAGECWVEQKYTTGNIKGQSYYFSLKEKQGPLKNGSKTFDYKGTWGNKEDAKTHHGTIQMTATCKPFDLGDGESGYAEMEKALGWNSETY